MSETNTAVIDALPFEGKGLTLEQAAANLLAIEDSDDDQTPDDPQVEEADAEEVEADEAESEEEEETEEADESESEEDEGDTEEAPDPTEPTLHKVKVNGEEIEVTYEELTAGYQKHSDYIRKTEEVANLRKTYEAEKAVYADRIEKLDGILTALQPAEPDWDKLRAENPAEYAAQREDWRRQQEDLAAVKAERERLAAEAAQGEAEQLNAYVEAQKAKLLEAIPEWKDSAKAKAEKEALFTGGAEAYGFTDEDFANVVDHRLVLMLRDALKFRELSTKGKEVVESKKVVQKVLQPGNPAPKPKGKQAEIIKLEKELKRTKDPKIAVRLFELMED